MITHQLFGTVNKDYILYLYQKENRLSWGQHLIDDSIGNELLDRIIDSMDSEDSTVLNLQSEYKSHIPAMLKFWHKGYCFDNEEYNDVNYQAIIEPEILSETTYNSLLRQAKKDAEQEWYEINNIKQTGTLTIDQLREKKESVELYLDDYKNGLMRRFLRAVREFIPAINYELALNDLKKEFSDIFFSHDYKGYTDKIWFSPTSDVVLSPKTNFVYGKASYFGIALKYMGVHILPYSKIISYNIQNTQQQVRFFKTYAPERGQWPVVMEDTVALFENIRMNRNDFVKSYILNPLKELVEQTHHIIEAPDSDLEFTEKELGFNSYCFFDTAHVQDKECFYKIIRLTNTLFLLDNLGELDNSKIANTQCYQDYIISINKQLLPLIEQFKEKTAIVHEKIKSKNSALKTKANSIPMRQDLERRFAIESNIRKMNKFLGDREDMIKKYIGE